MPSSQADNAALPSTTPKVNGWLTIVAAMLAGLAAALVIGQLGNVFKMSPDFDNIPLTPSPEYMARYNAAMSEYQSRNYAVHFTIIGAVLGLGIGAVGTVKNRVQALIASSIGGAMAGVVGGLLLGTAASYSVQVNRGEAINAWGVPIEPIVQTTAMQCFVWTMLGIGIGCGWTATVWGRKYIPKGIEGGLIGGLLAGVVHCIVASIFFTNSSGFTFVPESLIERIVWATLCSTCIGLGLIYSTATPRSKIDSTASR